MNTQNDPRHCGACGSACMLANVVTPVCALGQCAVGVCTGGYADCDGIGMNGCEVNVRGSDVMNCGACGRACRYANAAATCANGACAMGSCGTGYADCDGDPSNGCEVNLNTDGANCGVLAPGRAARAPRGQRRRAAPPAARAPPTARATA
ncbi:MAG: hypothetical protein U0325_25255 [Polyangiales bacterium]